MFKAIKIGALLATVSALAWLAALAVQPPAAIAIAISSPSDLAMSAIPGTGGSSSGTVAWNVSGSLLNYNLEVHASAAPAMTSGANSIADYHLTTPGTWSVAAADSEFGFSAQGDDTPTGTWGTPGSGSGKYRGFAGTTDIQIASGFLPLLGSTTTTVYFMAEVGASHFQVSGTYNAVITATATGL